MISNKKLNQFVEAKRWTCFRAPEIDTLKSTIIGTESNLQSDKISFYWYLSCLGRQERKNTNFCGFEINNVSEFPYSKNVILSDQKLNPLS